jgi:NAD-dependent dihydropyrimidine dehydrogenase PreA subunit
MTEMPARRDRRPRRPRSVSDASRAPTDRAVYATAEPGVFSPIIIDEELCIGCNLCVFVCQADLFLPNEVKGGAPSVIYPGECWYEGSCVDYCPVPGAITLDTQLFNKVHWEVSKPPPQ